MNRRIKSFVYLVKSLDTRNMETRGLLLEIIGLVFILSSALWQGLILDWYDTYPVKTQSYTEETAHLATLNSINQIALALSTNDVAVRNSFLHKTNELIGSTTENIIRTREQSESLEKREATPHKIARLLLFLIGTFLILESKIFIMFHKARTSKT